MQISPEKLLCARCDPPDSSPLIKGLGQTLGVKYMSFGHSVSICCGSANYVLVGTCNGEVTWRNMRTERLARGEGKRVHSSPLL